MELWSRFLALVRVSYILNLLKSDGKSRCNVFLLVSLAKKNYNMIFHHFSRGIGNNQCLFSRPKVGTLLRVSDKRSGVKTPATDEPSTLNPLYFQIKVVNNLFPCNCRVIYLVESVFGKRDPQFLDNNKCISPYKLNGKPMSVMRNNGMLKQCDRKAVMDQAK